ncbi:MAG: type II secretion system F family protein [Phycisphaeraceae bacterium]|nr:pilus assembly protein PilC [Planctomycetaceae bacterium]MCP4012896.1 type II secretion system F family protein [Phycisphaeraceae bacterium]MDG1359796.1 type II secretion system F family protein [Phycisphaerales bacterium]MCP4066772.1 type II secretion system F family protein [Phycisphaeraceae bacterium]MCP4498086.1 type II secretion system F family protein [Phycisphaeraceae bacterium]
MPAARVVGMAVFTYQARDDGGKRVDGRQEAASRAAIVSELQSRGLTPIAVREAAVAARGRKRLSDRRLAGAYGQLADLLKAGVPLLRSLGLVARGKSDPRLAAAMAGIAERVSEGERLADSMRSIGGFPEIHIAMVQAGERGGFLEEVLSELSTFLEHQAERRATVLGNMIYPVILLLVGVGVIVAALVLFVPKFQDFFGEMELPLATRLLLGMSDLVTGWWPLAVVLVVGGVVGWILVRDRPGIRHHAAGLQLRLPLVGDLVRTMAVARFTRMLGTLLANGIPLLASMRISREAAGNPLLADAIDAAAEAVGGGESLARPLEQSGLFGEEVVEMISVGESANNLPVVLVGIARNAERRTDRILGTMLKLMEPAMLLVLAGAVMFIFLALVVPMMSLSSQID